MAYPDTIPNWKIMSDDSGDFQYHEMDGSGEFSGNVAIFKGKRKFLCHWVNWPRLVRKIIGEITVGPGGTIIIPPQPWPGIPQLLAKDVVVKGAGPPSDSGAVDVDGEGSVVYPYAIVEIEYDNAQPTASTPQDLAAFSGDIKNECFRPEKGQYRYKLIPGQDTRGQDGAIIEHEIVIPSPSIEFMVAQPRVVNDGTLFPRILSVLGKINDRPFIGIASECVLYEGASFAAPIMGGAIFTVDLLHRFRARPVSWNRVYRGGTGDVGPSSLTGWREVDPPPFVLTDFTGTLFP